MHKGAKQGGEPCEHDTLGGRVCLHFVVKTQPNVFEHARERVVQEPQLARPRGAHDELRGELRCHLPRQAHVGGVLPYVRGDGLEHDLILPVCVVSPRAQHEVACKGAEVSRGAEAAIKARQLAEADEVGPPDRDPRVRQLRDLMAARMAPDELPVSDDNCVWRPVRAEQRGDARVEDVEVGARVCQQRDWQREVEPRVDERIKRRRKRVWRDERFSESVLRCACDGRVEAAGAEKQGF